MQDKKGNKTSNYSLDPMEVKRVIELKLAGKEYDEEQFKFYHLNRNHFNVKNNVVALTAIGGDKFIDINGNIWEEQSAIKNLFHMTPDEMVMPRKPRKFLRDDNSLLGGEFEIVIRPDETRITGNVSCRLQETYNFGRTREIGKHKTLDVTPHFWDGLFTCNYKSFEKMDSIRIIDLPKK